MTSNEQAPVGIDTSKPHPARLYDYYLGGKDNYLVDRAFAERVLAIAPEGRAVALANRAFMRRAVRFLVGSAGIRQIIDVGTGIPGIGNVHEVAQQVDPAVRVVYVDNDPVVNIHATALLTGTDTTGIVLADLRDPEAILGHPTVRGLIDFDQPVALLLVAILHFIQDSEDPAEIVATFRDALPPGSFLVLSHATGDLRPEVAARITEVYTEASSPANFRGHAEIEALFVGAELVEPGLVQVPLWRPDDSPRKARKGLESMWIYGGVGTWPGAVAPLP